MTAMVLKNLTVRGQRQRGGCGSGDRGVEGPQFLYYPHGSSLRGRGGRDNGQSDWRTCREKRQNCDG